MAAIAGALPASSAGWQKPAHRNAHPHAIVTIRTRPGIFPYPAAAHRQICTRVCYGGLGNSAHRTSSGLDAFATCTPFTPHRIGRAPSSASARKSPGPRSACTHLWCSVHCPPPRAPPRADDRGRSTTRLEGASAGPTAERNKMHAAGGANDAATRRPVAAVYARTCFAPPAITPASPPAAVRALASLGKPSPPLAARSWRRYQRPYIILRSHSSKQTPQVPIPDHALSSFQ